MRLYKYLEHHLFSLFTFNDESFVFILFCVHLIEHTLRRTHVFVIIKLKELYGKESSYL